MLSIQILATEDSFFHTKFLNVWLQKIHYFVQNQVVSSLFISWHTKTREKDNEVEHTRPIRWGMIHCWKDQTLFRNTTLKKFPAKIVGIWSLISGMLKFNCRKVIVLITRFSGIVLSPKSNLKVISSATGFIRLSSNVMLLGYLSWTKNINKFYLILFN